MQFPAWLIIWLPLAGFLFNALLGKRLGKTAVAYVAPGVVLAAFVVAASLWPEVMRAEHHRLFVPMIPGVSAQTPWIHVANFQVNFGLMIDPLSLLMTLIVTGVGGLIHVYATGYMADDPEQPRFFTYFNLFIFMMLVLVLAENFLLMFVGWEGVGTCSYLLISFWHLDMANARAGNKAFIVNRVGDLGFALGMMAIWSVFGTLSFFTPAGTGVMDMAAHAGGAMSAAGTMVPAATITLICVLLFIGATGKSAQIPLWLWLPDAMAGPTPVSALIHAATMVTAGVVMLTRCSWLFVQSAPALQLVAWIGLATALFGATIGLVQNDIKRVLAFSTVSQLGYMFLACGSGNFTAGMFHVTTHAFFKALLFLGAGAVIHSMQGEQDMRHMGGLKQKLFTTWLVMLVGTYAIAGFPLLSGFWSKDAVLDSALQAPWGSVSACWTLYIVGLATAFMTAFYMNRLMWKTFYTDARFTDGALPEHQHGNFLPKQIHEGAGAAAHHGEHAAGHGSVHASPPSMMFPLYVLALLSIGFGFYGHYNGNFEHFLAPSVAPLHLNPHLHEPAERLGHFAGIPAGYVISSIVAILGLALAAQAYGAKRATGELVPAKTRAEWLRDPSDPYTAALNGWWLDTLYTTIFVKYGGWFAEHILWRTIDQMFIDGIIVKGLGGGVGLISSVTRRWQTGYVRNYALAMLGGVVVIVSGLLYTWSHLGPR